MLKSSLFDYTDIYIYIYILVKESILVSNTETAAASNKVNIKVMLKNFVPFTNCICKINSTQVDNSKDIEVVMAM